ncbi:formin-like region domain-containing protein [Rhizoctonia solani AG-1 IA]|uniref:Formin-like region domain-containing protein n=1 Tax=Thanatephorus cucumeris (strain AG1-IA) TaxID=983506 RepID=L8X3K6_THACA|nr:formin-like region domain-containing protein [Rhizoctonia solani AG-1 IA]
MFSSASLVPPLQTHNMIAIIELYKKQPIWHEELAVHCITIALRTHDHHVLALGSSLPSSPASSSTSDEKLLLSLQALFTLPLRCVYVYDSLFNMMATAHSAAPHTLPSSAAMYFPPPRRSGSTLQPPSVALGDSHRPCVELHKPVWVIDYDSNEVTITGEIEVDTSHFARHAEFAIGVELRSPTGLGSNSNWRSEWNHDGPNNRPSSFIQLGQRLTVDESAYTTVTINLPQALLPASQQSRVFTLSCCAFLVDDPRVKSEMNIAKFMVVRKAAPAPAPTHTHIAGPVMVPVVQVIPPPCETVVISSGKTGHSARVWMGKKAWGKVAKW